MIWDEAPMTKRFVIDETVDRTFRDIMNSFEPFDGMVFVFGGDFHQVLPTTPRATRQHIVNVGLVKSHLLRNYENA